MKSRWAVVWRGRNCVVYSKAPGEWTLDPDEAYVFWSRFGAGFAVAMHGKGEVARCWT